MTLFESLVAIVILGLTATGFLGALHATSRSTLDADDWVRAVGWAEAAMEETKLGPAGQPLPDLRGLPANSRVVEVTPWPELPGVARITVAVTLPDGGTFVLHRLQRTP